MNYDLEMEKQIKDTHEGATLLLHACCAPCSSAVLERLGNFFRITIFFYNPNITEEPEYKIRQVEIKNFLEKIPSKYPIHFLEGRYDTTEFFEITKGLEIEKERGKRCYQCYQLRLEETAKIAEQQKYDFFTTTLSLSPYKNSKWINEIGRSLDETCQCNFLYSDFKKKGGYQRSIELSNEYQLYRQNYCGCIYSKREQEQKK